MQYEAVPEQLRVPSYVMPQATQHLAFYLFWAAAILAFIVAFVISRRQQSWKPLLYTLGGGATFLYEPLLARATHVAHSQIGANIAFESNLVVVPWHIIGSYVPYFALALLTLVPLFHRRTLSLKGVYWVAVGVAAGVWAFESPWIALDLWHYYGRQSVRPFGLMPVWAAVGTSMLTYCTALVVARVQDSLNGARCLLLVPGVIVVSFASAAGVCWPMWLVMASNWSDWLIHLAAAAVIALAAMVVYITAPLVARPLLRPAQ